MTSGAPPTRSSVVRGDALEPPPQDMDVNLSMDSLCAGGGSAWVSVEASVGKSDVAHTELPSKRLPADLLIVVDVSGSMNAVLPSVRKCLAALSALVEDEDRIALVKFDNQCSVVMLWTSMDEEGVEKFVEAQTSLVACGGTSFVPVFNLCFDDLLAADSPGHSRSMLFMSDGVPDERDGDILRTLTTKLRSANISVILAGFGTGTKSELMSAIGHCGCGPFVYIPEPSHIPQQLGRIWASVAHTSVASCFAVVRPLGGARIAAVEGAFGAAELSLRPDGRPS
mmetsp:Transcript_40081/g.128576  ORF Transcript_40081/g.128576 Transcript_40081/m.128576 type:complete len:283 (+) Transcript_40081:279-1127(+)